MERISILGSLKKYMEINPTWTVPPGILNDTFLPGLKQNPHGTQLERFVVYDRKGKLVVVDTDDNTTDTGTDSSSSSRVSSSSSGGRQ